MLGAILIDIFTMDDYSQKTVEALKILDLISGNVASGISLLEENNAVFRSLAVKSIYIDACSFLDEINMLTSILQKEIFLDYTNVNRFLLLSHKSRKILNQKGKILSNLRNTIFAHNYRDKSKSYVDPLACAFDYPKGAPLFNDELNFISEIIFIINSLAQECFSFNSDIAYSETKASIKAFTEEIFPLIKELKSENLVEDIHQIRQDISQIKDSLTNSSDNYKIIAKKLKCKIREL